MTPEVRQDGSRDPATPPKQAAGAALVALAREAIAEALGGTGRRPEPRSSGAAADWLERRAATFVTLRRRGRLRGCVGSLEAKRPLGADVRHNALGAAFRDPRFPPLAPGELDALEIEVSVLSPLEPIAFADEEDALEQLVPGRDGVVLVYGGRRSTFLPKVWSDLPSPADFLGELKEKAGLPAGFWSPGIALYRYSIESFGGPAHDGAAEAP